MKRDLKSQMERDVRRVFLNLGEHGELEHLKYYRHRSEPPVELHIPVVVSEAGTDNRVWNKNKVSQRVGHDETLYQANKTLYCALADLRQKPRRGRELEVGSERYEILSVSCVDGMVELELKALEE